MEGSKTNGFFGAEHNKEGTVDIKNKSNTGEPIGRGDLPVGRVGEGENSEDPVPAQKRTPRDAQALQANPRPCCGEDRLRVEARCGDGAGAVPICRWRIRC
eukprot:g3906.t1